MRKLGRRLAYSICAGLLLLLWVNCFHTSIGDRLLAIFTGDGDAEFRARLPPLQHDSIQQLWAHWSQVILDTKPQVPVIDLTLNAPNVFIQHADRSIRVHMRDLVVNSKRVSKSMRKSHGKFMQELNRLDDRSELFSGYGIAMVAGGEFFGSALTTIQMLRRSGSELPVEIFVANETEYESDLCDSYLPKLNAKCLVLTDFLKTPPSRELKIKRFQLKGLALLFTSFKHVLFLDSDSIPLMDPYEQIMTKEPYTSTGMVIWPDFWRSTESPSFWKIAGKKSFPTGLPQTGCETGQMLVNKETHLKAVLLAVYYNLWGPGYFYPLLSQGAMGQGDKETFMAAAVVAKTPYYRVMEQVQAIMNDDGVKTRGRAMVQAHPGDDLAVARESGGNVSSVERLIRPMFLHANIPKMNVGHLMDEGDIYSAVNKSKRHRLLGLKRKAVKRFGYDLEAILWELMEATACELQFVLKDWKGREDLCERAREHVRALFHQSPDAVVPAGRVPAFELQTKMMNKGNRAAGEVVHNTRRNRGLAYQEVRTTKKRRRRKDGGKEDDETMTEAGI